MWFGERSGIKRYDGYNLKAYYHNGLDTISLSDNYIISMYEDNDANIWIGSISGGLIRYNRNTDNFTRYPHSGNDPYNLKNASVWAICALKSGAIWFSAHSIMSQGIYAMDPRSGNIVPVVHGTSNSGHQDTLYTRIIYEDRNGNIWTGDAKGLHKYDSAGSLFIHYRNEPGNENSLSCDTVNAIYEDRSGTMWIGTYKGLNQFDRDANRFVRYYHDEANPNSLSDNYIGAITGDNEDNLIIKTATGINFLKKQTGSFVFLEYLDYVFSPEEAISYNIYGWSRSLYLDSCGILWFPSYGGFNKLILQRKQFTFIQSGGFNGGICQDNNGDLWIGSWGGGFSE
jgi:ligand-binding sensor domain-containing protein